MWQTLPGATIGNSFTFQKDELHIAIRDCDSIRDIHCSFHSPLPFLKTDKQPPNPKHRVVLFKEISGVSVSRVYWHQSDRQILIELHRHGYLLFLLYGMNGNVFYLNSDHEIVTSFRKSKMLPVFDPGNFTDEKLLPVREAALPTLISENPDVNLLQLFSKAPLSVYSKTFVREICFRANIDEQTLVVNLSKNRIRAIYREYISILKAVDQNVACVYEIIPPIFSLLPLQHLAGQRSKPFDSVSDGTNYYIAKFFRTHVLDATRQFLLRRLIGNLHLLQRKLARQEKELATLPTTDNYRIWADTILTNLHRIDNHLLSIILPKPDNPAEKITIPLNPKMTASENANKYYEKSKIAGQSRAQLQQTIETTANAIKRIAAWIGEVESCDDLKILRNIKSSIPKDLLEQKAARIETERLPYYSFTVGKYTILVGKSAKDNDLLSFKHARPGDFWFHTEYGPGSHVIVRNPTRQESLPNNIIETAAGIAAFYSKAKHSGAVPVIYTKRKYIWKRKDMPPGRVFTKFTKSVIVEPLDPRKLG
jgi:predicted ribosome quality control (RQC) complex YloA/Tae2 family protein